MALGAPWLLVLELLVGGAEKQRTQSWRSLEAARVMSSVHCKLDLSYSFPHLCTGTCTLFPITLLRSRCKLSRPVVGRVLSFSLAAVLADLDAGIRASNAFGAAPLSRSDPNLRMLASRIWNRPPAEDRKQSFSLVRNLWRSLQRRTRRGSAPLPRAMKPEGEALLQATIRDYREEDGDASLPLGEIRRGAGIASVTSVLETYQTCVLPEERA